MSESEPAVVLAAFLARFVADDEAGAVRPVSDYQALFPGFEEVIAREYESLLSDADGDEPVLPSADGLRVVDRYRLVKELGRGGQSVVYLAEDTELGRKVALKLLPASLLASERSKERFRREAEIAARLDHPGVCVILETGEHDGMPFIAMRYIDGESLADHIATARSQSTESEELTYLDIPDVPETDWDAPVPPDVTPDTSEINRIVALVEKVARALHAAHENGLLHRDVKPGNIMVTPSGEPIILDFGLARDELRDGRTLTMSGDLMGTPAYMSPEQLLAQRIRLDRRSDVYSLGVTLYECLTLTRPFEAPTREALYQRILTGEVPDPRRINRDISKDLKVVIETALEKDRARRYPSALAFAEDLRRLRLFEPITARPAGPLLRFRRWIRRKPATATACLAFLVLLVGGLAATLLVNAELADRNHELELSVAAARSARASLSTTLAEKSDLLREAEGRRLAAEALDALGRDQTLALHLAIMGNERIDNVETDRALRRALNAAREIRTFDAHDGTVNSVAFDPSGEHIVSVGRDRHLRTWSIAEGKRLLDVNVDLKRGRFERVPARARFLDNGARIAMVSNFPLAFFDAKSGDMATGHTMSKVDSRVTYAPDGRRAAAPLTLRVGRGDEGWLYGIRIWDVESGRTLCEIEHAQFFSDLAFSHDGRRLVANDFGSTLVVIDVEKGAIVRSLDLSSQTVALNEDGSRLAVGMTGRVVVHDVATGAEIDAFALETPRERPLVVGHDPSGARLVAGLTNGAVQIWRVDRSRAPLFLRGHYRWVRDVAFSPDGSRIATAGDDGTVRVWDARPLDTKHGGVQKERWHGDPSWKSDVFSGFGYRSTHRGDGDEPNRGVVTVQDKSGGELWRLEVEELVATHASPAGDALLVASRTAGVHIHDAASGNLIRSFARDDGVSDAAWNHSGDRIATAAKGGLIRIWNAETGALLVEARGHNDAVTGISFSPDGTLLASASKDRTARLWDASTGRPRATLMVDAKLSNAPAWSEDGTRLRIVFLGPRTPENTYTYLQRVVPVHPLEGARKRLARPMTQDERLRHGS